MQPDIKIDRYRNKRLSSNSSPELRNRAGTHENVALSRVEVSPTLNFLCIKMLTVNLI